MSPIRERATGARIAIGWLDLALALRPRFRTIAADYPHSVASFDDLATGILAILDAEGVERAHVVGQSAGGMLAEVLSHRAPQRVASMVLSGTGLYGPKDVARLEAIRSTPWHLPVPRVNARGPAGLLAGREPAGSFKKATRSAM